MAYTPPIDEKQLVQDLKNPETAARSFQTLMRTYGEKMYWQIRKLVHSHEDADDLLQASFIKAWKNINNFRGEAKLSTWLYKIAINESINFLNKEKQRQMVSTDDDEQGVARTLESDPWFDGDKVQLALQEAIAKLPEKQRLVFNLRYFDEMKYEEMSEVLGTSVGALKASYHHAVKKLEDYLSGIDF